MRDHSKHIELSREDAVSAMLQACDFAFEFGCKGAQDIAAARAEMVPLTSAYGRVLAQDVTSRVDSPTVRTCCMDSVAVHFSDFEAAVSALEAGSKETAQKALPDYSKWVRGVDWEFANTGIAMPEGFDTAVVIEHVKVSDDALHIEIDAPPSKKFAGTRAPGDKMKVGDVVARAGSVITPDVSALIGSANVSHVRVVRRPRVAFLPTGNELMPPAVPARSDGKFAALGKNFETNSLLVAGRVMEWGGSCQVWDIVPDEPALIETAIHEACACADIVVLNAGSSKGSDDWSCEQMEEIGEVLFHETNHGPGHHSSFAVVDNTPVVGISGPSRGASLTLNFYLKPLVNAYLGLPTAPKTAFARLDEDFPVRPKPGMKGGPGGKGGASGHSGKQDGGAGKQDGGTKGAKMAGETRPSVVKNDRKFFGIKPVCVEFGADGVLHVKPAPGPDPHVTCNATYMMPANPDAHPHAGDLIEIEWR